MEQSYDTNFSKITLIFQEQIFLTNDYKILLNIPSVKAWLNDTKCNMLVSYLKDDKYWNNGFFVASNRIEAVCGMKKFGSIYQDILAPWSNIFPNLTIEPKGIKCDDKFISVEDFNTITDMLMVGCGVITYEDYNSAHKESKEEEDDVVAAFKAKMKATQDKIKKMKGEKQGESYPLDKMFACILSFFPQYTFQTIKELNYYTIVYLFEWAQKRSIQEVNNIAAGSGLLKKYEPIF